MKAYFCYFGGYPGLAPTTPQPPHIVPKASRTFKMPPFKGPEWEHVVILGQKGQN